MLGGHARQRCLRHARAVHSHQRRGMKLAPRELEKLTLHNAGFLAQKRLARGLRLNEPEAVALLATQMLEMIRDGRPVHELMLVGKEVLGLRQVLPGVAAALPEIQVEGTFPDGTKLLTVHSPICQLDGDMTLALYGSFLPVPDLDVFGETADGAAEVAGQFVCAGGEIILNEGRELVEVLVANTGDRPIQVGSHYHFLETNPALEFDRGLAYGRRLNVPAGSSVRFEPGDKKTVTLVDIAGKRIVKGGNNLTDGEASQERKAEVMDRVVARGFKHKEQASVKSGDPFIMDRQHYGAR
jgi:urease beta subunit/urease gamma subunit